MLYVFWLFFFVLIFWLHREGKREGYPLESDMGIGGLREGFPLMASPKTFLRKDGSKVVPETDRTEPAWHAKRMAPIPGSPYVPEGRAWRPQLALAVTPTAPTFPTPPGMAVQCSYPCAICRNTA